MKIILCVLLGLGIASCIPSENELLLHRAQCEQKLQAENSADSYCTVPGTTMVVLRLGLKE